MKKYIKQNKIKNKISVKSLMLLHNKAASVPGVVYMPVLPATPEAQESQGENPRDPS
jgi:hypothetical protein